MSRNVKSFPACVEGGGNISRCVASTAKIYRELGRNGSCSIPSHVACNDALRRWNHPRRGIVGESPVGTRRSRGRIHVQHSRARAIGGARPRPTPLAPCHRGRSATALDRAADSGPRPRSDQAHLAPASERSKVISKSERHRLTRGAHLAYSWNCSTPSRRRSLARRLLSIPSTSAALRTTPPVSLSACWMSCLARASRAAS